MQLKLLDVRHNGDASKSKRCRKVAQRYFENLNKKLLFYNDKKMIFYLLHLTILDFLQNLKELDVLHKPIGFSAALFVVFT